MARVWTRRREVFNKVIHRFPGRLLKPRKINDLGSFPRKILISKTIQINQTNKTMNTPLHWVDVAVQTPAHSQVGAWLTYTHPCTLPAGTLVRVPLGTREVLGVVWQSHTDKPPHLAADKARAITHVLDLHALNTHWMDLVAFAARYYQRSVGEVAAQALPPGLHKLSPEQLQRRLSKLCSDAPLQTQPHPPASEQQAQALECIEQQPGPFLLFGNTGSGKTEVYLQAIDRALGQDNTSQALLLVPEINLTPQLLERVQDRFGHEAVVAMHSGLTPAQRLKSWLQAHLGIARIVLGTRMAIFASLPHLRMIVVDEEHDPSYKQQEGARYSARDLAIYRSKQQGAKVILGSATPSLESWHQSRPEAEGGRYVRLHMPQRVGHGNMPVIRRVDMNHQPRNTRISAPLIQALQERLARGEQSLLLLNRRGYAPVLQCTDCGWKSDCPQCSAFRVFHKNDRSLRCHHCGLTQRVPKACPQCGNPDILPLGLGTEQLQEHVTELLGHLQRPDGQPVQIARMDADTTQHAGQLQAQLQQMHAGEVDILIGTQMIAKGHDFRRVTLVAALNPDNGLFSSDFRAPERLFALLMQAAGRAGREAGSSKQAEMWVQTHHPDHAVFRHLKAHDYPGFAHDELQDREQAGLPPFVHQALLRADARTQETAQALLQAAQDNLQRQPENWGLSRAALESVSLFPPVPMSMQRVANVERSQMLIESSSRAHLHQTLFALQQLMHQLRSQPQHKGVLRWLVDVDPQAI